MLSSIVPPPIGLVHVKLFRHGKLIEDWKSENLVVASAGLINAANIGGTTAGNAISQVGFGPSLLAPVPDNTQLGAGAYMKNLDGPPTFPAANQVVFPFSLQVYEANGQDIGEYGLFTSSAALYARVVRSGLLTKDLSMALQATWTLTFPSAPS